MPARSNDFQKVIYFVQRHIAPDATVRESVMLADKITGQPREVDVLMEGTIGPNPIRIAIEVRRHKRKASVEWIEQVHTKYETLPVNKVVLVSHSGFTRSALNKANFYDIETVTPSQEISQYGPLARLPVELQTSTVRGVKFLDGVVWLDGLEKPVRATAHVLVFTPDGVQASSIESLTSAALAFHGSWGEIFENAEPEHKQLTVTFVDLEMRRPDGRPFRPHVRVDGAMHKIERLLARWEIDVSVTQVEMEHGAMQGTPFAFGSASILGEETLVVVAGEPVLPDVESVDDVAALETGD